MLSKIRDYGDLFYVVCVLDFYALPLFCNGFGSEIIIFMVLMPLILFISSVFYGYKMGLNWHYFVTVSLLFAPNLFRHYASTWISFVLIAAVAYIGNLLGNEFGKAVEVSDNQLQLEG